MSPIIIPGYKPIELRTLMPFAKDENCKLYAKPLSIAMATFEINTPTRVGMFLAQLTHESGSLKYTHEIWQDTERQKSYERNFFHAWPPIAQDDLNRTAWNLGNSEKGDGKRFMGRGPMQATGRYNYVQFGKWSNYDFVKDPEAMAKPGAGSMFAGWFWMIKGLNALADHDDFRNVTKRINGGLTRYADRTLHYVRIMKILHDPNLLLSAA